MAEERFPILGKGEELAEQIPGPPGGGPKKHIRSFKQARERLLPQYESLIEEIYQIPSKLRLDRIYFSVTLDSAFLAKSYYPSTFEKKCGWQFVGSRPWKQIKRDDKEFLQPELTRRLFYCAHSKVIESAFERLKAIDSLKDQEKTEYRTIDHLMLPGPKQRVLSKPIEDRPTMMELVFHPMTKPEWEECQNKIWDILGDTAIDRFFRRFALGGGSDPIFLPALISPVEINTLGEYNPLRALRIAPGISFPRIQKDVIEQTNPPTRQVSLRAGDVTEVGVFDGGADTDLPHLKNYVQNIDITVEPTDGGALEHGTAVCGAVLYGPIDPDATLASPDLRVKSFRVFPVPTVQGHDLDLYRVLRWVRHTIEDPVNRHIKTFVLSFGPDIPVEDIEVDPFTATLDQLAYEHDVLFIVAAGNNGRMVSPMNRIQPPSDLVNGLGIGAYSLDVNDTPQPTVYTCVGPGRPGSQVKPDLCAFGGSDESPFYVLLAGEPGTIAGEKGTSFAAPLAGAAASRLLYHSTHPDIVTPQISKALLIHHAHSITEWQKDIHGWGPMLSNPESLMTSSANEVKVLYYGRIDFTKWVRLKLPFPESLEIGGKILFDWTIVYACGVAPAAPDEYTLAGKEVRFRPHELKYRFTKGGKTKTVNIASGAEIALNLEGDGWKQSMYPVTGKYKKEQQLREEGKWDTVIKGSATLYSASVRKPVLDLHAIPRAEWANSRLGHLNYAVVVSMKTTDSSIPLYEHVRAQYRQLVPVRLRTRVRI